VSSQNVYIYAWMDFDKDDTFSSGDLFGYYGYTSGNPLVGQATLITLSNGQIRQLDFNIAPLIDIRNRPELSTYDQERLKAFKENVIKNYYENLRKK
ncbi:MAG: hypothetical protein ACK4E2_06805, partial [Pseudothermotoga sp.]